MDWLKLKMSEHEYRIADGINKSTMWKIKRSPAHYHYAITHPQEDTPAFKFGRAVHAAILTPEDFSTDWVVMPDFNTRTKDGKAEKEKFESEHFGQEIITAKEFDQITMIAGAVADNKKAMRLLRFAYKEVPMFWKDQVFKKRCKGRADAVWVTDRDKQGYRTIKLIDVKTCRDASKDKFMREALEYGYDVQAAHYVEGAMAQLRSKSKTRCEFWFVAVEKDPPYAVNILKCGDAFIQRGVDLRYQLMERIKKYEKDVKKGIIPDYGEDELILPTWAECPVLD